MRPSGGFTLLESLMALSLLLIMSVVTTLLYRNVSGTIQFSTSRMESTRLLRTTLARLAPLLTTAYIPPVAGATFCFETPLAPYPSGVTSSDPLATRGVGVNSFLFYSPVDLLDPQSELLPLDRQSPHLYEVRLLETLQPDRSAHGGPALQLRDVVLQERRVPVKFGVGPFPLLAGRTRTIVCGLSDLRFTRISSVGVHVRVEAQGRQRTLNPSRGQTMVTSVLESKIYFPVVSQ